MGERKSGRDQPHYLVEKMPCSTGNRCVKSMFNRPDKSDKEVRLEDVRTAR
jgi:hypothetical protein